MPEIKNSLHGAGSKNYASVKSKLTQTNARCNADLDETAIRQNFENELEAPEEKH